MANRAAMPSFDEIKPHLKTGLFITGSFCIAWSWDLVAYGISHAWNDENPMKSEIGFGDQDSPKYLPALLIEYLAVVGVASALSVTVKEQYHDKEWCAAAIMAVEFFPSPFFSGKLMAFLGQFSTLSSLYKALLNLLATAFAAFLVHAANNPRVSSISRFQIPSKLHRFRPILGETLGFGLGVAWNVLLADQLAPKEMNVVHLIGFLGYLLLVLMIALRLSALSKEDEETEEGPTLMQRTLSLLSFAFNVVSAFTMTNFLRTVMPQGWIGDILCLIILILVAACLSAIVESVDIQLAEDQMEESDSRKYGFGTCCAIDVLIFVPCAWCCCPWVPLLWILAGTTPDVDVKEKWQGLIAFILGLSSSIQASGILTNLTNLMATTCGICNADYCNHKWLFVALQIFLALVVTMLLLPLLGLVSEPVHVERHELSEYDGVDEERQQLKA